MEISSAINTRVRKPIAKLLHTVSSRKETPYAASIRSNLPVYTELSQTPVWEETRLELVECLKGDYSNFMNWKPVQATLFHEPDPRAELAFLKKDWKRWKPIIQETWIGNPKPYPWYLKTSGNLLHNVYNIAYFLEKTGVDITKLDSITEFGGGYGVLCKAIHDMGFKGDYRIFDFPELHMLQEYYLKSCNVPFIPVDTITETENPDLFIAYWSLTESPFELRNTIFKAISPKYYSMTFAGNFRGLDNLKYFDENLPKGYRWEIEPRPQYKDTYSLVGVKN